MAAVCQSANNLNPPQGFFGKEFSEIRAPGRIVPL